MKYPFQYLHPDFTLNDTSFRDLEELVEFVKKKYPGHARFLKNWLNADKQIQLQTSGSTGKPKCIAFDKEQLILSAKRTIDFFDLPPTSRALHNLNPDFVAGKMMWVRALVGGWHLIVQNPSEKIPGEIFDFGAMVPRQVEKNLAALKNFKKLLIGGASVSIELEKHLKEQKNLIFHTYGMTETLTHVAVKPITHEACEHLKVKLKQCNREFYHALQGIRFSENNGKLIVTDKQLDIRISTNDLVELKNEKQFKWIGRSDWVVNTGGIKVIPEQVEEKLKPFISGRFIVAGIPDKTWGEMLVLIIEGERFEIDHNIFDQAKLKYYEKPKKIFFLKEFFETSGGKINRLKIIQEIM